MQCDYCAGLMFEGCYISFNNRGFEVCGSCWDHLDYLKRQQKELIQALKPMREIKRYDNG